jgi:hypothetical protein
MYKKQSIDARAKGSILLLSLAKKEVHKADYVP